jgi:hypothetical protein
MKAKSSLSITDSATIDRFMENKGPRTTSADNHNDNSYHFHLE